MSQTEQLLSLDQAADVLIAEAKKDPRLPDKSLYGIHRAAEAEAWANASTAGADTELGGQWAEIAARIGEKYHEAQRTQNAERRAQR